MGRNTAGRGNGHSGGRGNSAHGTYRLDGLLGPRVEDYAREHDASDADAVVEYLRCD